MIETAMGQPWPGYALDLLIKATLILAVTGMLVLMLNRASAATRHLVWTVGIVGLVALPLLSLVLPAWQVGIALPRSPVSMEWAPSAEQPREIGRHATSFEGTRAPGAPGGAGRGVTRALEGSATGAPEGSVEGLASGAVAGSLEGSGAGSLEGSPWDAMAAGEIPAARSEPIPRVALFAGLWAAGTTLLLLRLLSGWWGLARLKRSAERIASPEWEQALKDAAWMLDVDRPVTLLRSARASMPMTWGTVRPVILLPEEADRWPAERRRVVLLHELAHVARRDCLTQTLADLARAVYWFHPLSWIAAERLRTERERACDDRVLSAGERASDYATHLLEVARAYRTQSGFGGAAIAMARPSQFEGRLLAVLDGARKRQAPGRRARALAISLPALLLLPLAAIRSGDAQATDLDSRTLTAQLERTISESTTREGRVAAPSPPPESYGSMTGVAPAGLASAADSVIEGMVVARQGGNVRLQLGAGGVVRIIGWGDDAVAMRARLRGAGAADAHVELTSRGGDVELLTGHADRRRNRSGSIAIELFVPARSNVEIVSAGGAVTIEGVAGSFSGSLAGGDISLRNVSGESRLRTGGGDVQVWDSQLDGEVQTGGGNVRIVGNLGNLRGFTGGGNIHVDNAAAPPTLAAPFAEILRLTTGGGDIEIGDLDGGAQVTTGGGDIGIHSARGPITLHTGGGDVAVGRAGGAVDVQTGGGDVDIEAAAGPVRISTGKGDVRVAASPGVGAQDIQIAAGTGQVVLILPADFSADFHIEVTSFRGNAEERVRSDFPLSREVSGEGRGAALRAAGRLGTGANRIEIHTENGDVRILRAPAGAGLATTPGAASRSATATPPPPPTTTPRPPRWPGADRPDPAELGRVVGDAVRVGMQSSAAAIAASESLSAVVSDWANFLAAETFVAVSNGLNEAFVDLEREHIGRRVDTPSGSFAVPVEAAVPLEAGTGGIVPVPQHSVPTR